MLPDVSIGGINASYLAVGLLALVVVAALAARSVRKGGSHGLHALGWAVERLLILVLAPDRRDGSLARPNTVLWAIANVGLVFGPAVMGRAWSLTGALVATVLLHALILWAGLLVLNEEADVMEGVVLRDDKWFAENSPLANLAVLAISSALIVVGSGLLLYRLDDVHGLKLVVEGKAFACADWHCPISGYLLATLQQIPGVEWCLRQLGYERPVAFTVGLGRGFQSAFYFAMTLLAFGAFNAIYQQRKQIRSLFVALNELEDKEAVTYQQMRATRAPSYVRRLVIQTAINHPHSWTRSRMMTLVLRSRIYSFLPTFIYQLHDLDNDLKKQGLDTVVRFLKEKSDDIDNEILWGTLSTLKYQTEHQWAGHGEATRNRLNSLVIQLTSLAMARNLPDLATALPRKRLIGLAIDHPNVEVAEEALKLAEQVDPVTLCATLVSRIDGLEPERLTRNVVTAVRLLDQHGPRWKIKQLNSIKGIAQRAANDTRDELLRGELRRVHSAADKAQSRRKAGTKAA